MHVQWGNLLMLLGGMVIICFLHYYNCQEYKKRKIKFRTKMFNDEYRKNRIDISMNYLNGRIKKLPEYIIPDYITDNEDNNIFTNSPLIYRLFEDMKLHIDKKNRPLELKIKNKTDNHTGEYRQSSNREVITLYLNNTYTLQGITAILAHELSHFYLYHQGIEYVNTQENEILTEVTTAYLGFGKYMYKGYRDFLEYELVGYLDIDDFRYILNKIGILW